MNVKMHKSLIYQNKKMKKFYSFSLTFSLNVFLITEDGYTAKITLFEYLCLVVGIKSKKILNSKWLDQFSSKNELEDDVEIKPTFFLIEMTNNCNLRCKYCFRGEHLKKAITNRRLEEVLEAITKYIKKNKITSFSIQPWGGEPLLEIDKILFIRKYFDEQNLHPTINCETNGALLTTENAKKLLINDIDFGVSIDGISKIHDFNRPLANSNPSSNIIFKHVLDFSNNYPSYRLSVITTNTYYSSKYIKKNFRFLIEHLHVKNLKMNFVKNNPYMSKDISSFSPEEIAKFYKITYKELKKISKIHNDISEGNIALRILNLLYRSSIDLCNSHGCRGGKKMFAFDVEGDIYNCELIGEKSQYLGSYKDDFIDIVKKSMKNNSYFNDKRKKACENCPYVYFCMGGCSSTCLHENMTTDELTCAINRELYPLIIKDIIRNSFFINLYRRGKH